MIDLHCHLLPGIDDGSPDEATSLVMARIAVADGIETTACTPHIYPGLDENDAAGGSNPALPICSGAFSTKASRSGSRWGPMPT